MSSMSNYLENKLIDHLLRNRSFSAPATLYWALYSVAPSDAGGGTEFSGNNYARVAQTTSDTAFTNTQGTTSGASSGTGGTAANGEVVQFNTPSGNWGTAVAVALFDAPSGGNMLIKGAIFPRLINSGDDVKFPVGSLTFQIDD